MTNNFEVMRAFADRMNAAFICFCDKYERNPSRRELFTVHNLEFIGYEMEFPFPFPPYEIQKDFMINLYSCLENGKLGIFESPTGTGKSLSIICGAVKWLLDHDARLKKELTEKIEKLDERLEEFSEKSTGDWFSVQTAKLEISIERQKLQNKLDSMIKNEEKMLRIKQSVQENKKKRNFKSNTVKKTNSNALEFETNEDNEKGELPDDNLVLEDYSDGEDEGDDEKTEEEPFKNTKIYFCSRTHSQLSQFVGEMKRSPYQDSVRLVPLASRLNYCVNKDVRRLRHVNLMNERCLQLQRKRTTVKAEKTVKKSKNTTGCPYLPGNPELLRAEILTDIQDVEEIYQNAQELKTCAYYTSRNSVQDGQVIVVPYNSVLHKNTRISSGIDLKGNVLIIDEAHNLLDAIERMHSAEISGKIILQCYSQLMQYQNRYQSLFSAKSLLALNQLTFCLKKFIKVLGGTTKSCPDDKTSGTPKLYKMEEFEVICEIDTINIFQLLDFVKNSKLSHKLQGYVEKYRNDVKIHETEAKSGVKAFLHDLQEKTGEEETNANPVTLSKPVESNGNSMQAVVSFLECLKSRCSDGRVFLIPSGTVGCGLIKFLLLNPAAHFSDIVRDARAIVLAGGTMEPISEFKEQLFINSGADSDRIFTFSCDHVVPVENVVTSIVKRGPSGIQLEFNYQNRDNIHLLNELGRVLSNLCNVVPGGIVVFLPSYSYETTVYKHLEVSGTIHKITLKKRIFREPKLASQVDETLETYADSIKKPKGNRNGALLFSVVGGKLSEGLNFSDDLGRCVVVVGMPYPNSKSLELQEKIRYLNESVAPGTGNVFYENLCMKAVNQCIGRAVRHINDYATVVLLDARYANKTESVPKWIRRSLSIHDSFGTTIGGIAKFFARKKIKQT